jgi:hypothetical protein
VLLAAVAFDIWTKRRAGRSRSAAEPPPEKPTNVEGMPDAASALAVATDGPDAVDAAGSIGPQDRPSLVK